MLARLAPAMLGIVLALCNGTAQAQVQPAENPATLQAACDRNDYAACRRLAMQYKGGRLVPVDKVTAARLLRKACEGGDNEGCVTLGLTLQLGDGVPRDFTGAMVAYGRACDAGYSDGCNKLSHHYLYGWGVAEDVARANQLQGRACQLGDWASKYSCTEFAARLYSDAPKNIPEAFRLYHRACDLDDFRACGILAGYYASGSGIAQDAERAFPLAVKACDGNEGAGCSVAGLIVGNGTYGQRKDPARAAQLLEKACTLKNGTGCLYLGKAFETGEGVRRDAVRAANLARMACELNKRHCAPAAATASNAAPPARAALAPSPGRAAASSQTPRDADDSCSNNPDREVAASDCYVVGTLESSGLSGGPDWPKALWAYDRACTLGHRSGCTEAAKIRQIRGAISPRAPARAAAAPQAAPSARTAPGTAGGARLFTVFGMELGGERLDAVQSLIRRGGGTIANSPGDKRFDWRIKALSGDLPGADPRFTVIAFDFMGVADPILAAVFITYKYDVERILPDRIAALTRQYGANDGKGPGMVWHRVVPGAEISLYTEPTSGDLTERYMATK